MGDDNGNGICFLAGLIVGIVGTLAVLWIKAHVVVVP